MTESEARRMAKRAYRPFPNHKRKKGEIAISDSSINSDSRIRIHRKSKTGGVEPEISGSTSGGCCPCQPDRG